MTAYERRLEQRWPEIERLVPTVPRQVLWQKVLWAVEDLADDEVYPMMAPVQRAEKMEKVVDRARRLSHAINDLDPIDAARLEMSVVRMTIEHVIAAMGRGSVRRMPEEVGRRRRGSGSRQIKVDQFHRSKAAMWAFYVLSDNGVRPTLTRNGVWPKLSKIIFEIAYGRDGGKMYPVCLASELRASDYLD
jgi:hypothetical protein